jgi:hypothetical protein
MNRNYYVCSIGQPEEGYDDENLIRCIMNSCFVLHEYNKYKGSIEDIRPNDILILKYKHQFIGYGKATNNLEIKDDIADGTGWKLTIKVSLWIMGSQTSKYGIKNAQESGTAYDTVKKVNSEFALSKMSEIGFPF